MFWPEERLTTSSRCLLFFIILSKKMDLVQKKNQPNFFKAFWLSSKDDYSFSRVTRMHWLGWAFYQNWKMGLRLALVHICCILFPQKFSLFDTLSINHVSVKDLLFLSKYQTVFLNSWCLANWWCHKLSDSSNVWQIEKRERWKYKNLNILSMKKVF